MVEDIRVQKAREAAILIWNLDSLARTYASLGIASVPYQLTFPGLISDLVNPPDINNSWYELPLGDMQLKSQSLVAERFARAILWHDFRLENISKYPFWGSLRKNRIFSKEVKSEAALWVAVWNLISQLCALGVIPQHQITVFRLIVQERELLQFQFQNEPVTPTEATKRWRTQNRLLRSLENPFDSITIAGRVIGSAQVMAENSQPFRRDYYNKVHRARVAVVANIAKSHPITISTEGKFSLQGHREKS
jgi:hypothetical protein